MLAGNPARHVISDAVTDPIPEAVPMMAFDSMPLLWLRSEFKNSSVDTESMFNLCCPGGN
ncbi:hypothetical protein SDC9_84135 [bioreactor metagenome]|uniref:Uncharacterized protein n=1 Tax=bioreactor metagenome TaxID=1076179 RepID=A0A644ZA21_9ZZZZ